VHQPSAPSAGVRSLFPTLQQLHAGSYTEAAGFQRLQEVLEEREAALGGGRAVGRMYYLALPPSVYAPVVKGLKEHADMRPSNPK
jgi:glucose-6-phosphate 1-dehydrogenase